MPGQDKPPIPCGGEEGLPDASAHAPTETARPACLRRAVAMFTAFLTSADIEATARRTGVVPGASKMPGTRDRARITLGFWRAAHTTVAPGAAPIKPLGPQVDVSPVHTFPSWLRR